ncbi:MAG: hypothetical protein LC746_12065 [Acidobacteria bacterium]|nr:hypothetical protein [Acidobacteriota bacterium]
MKNTKLAIHFLTALAALSISLAASAQKQTRTHSHNQSRSQPQQSQPQRKADGQGGASHDAMSHDGMSHDAMSHDGMSREGCPVTGGNRQAGGDARHAEMNARGDRAMGFSQTGTTHHFTLAADGGAIQVEADDARDAASRAQIREHLAHIAQAFAAGNFETPSLVHGEAPPGVAVMRKLKAGISYRYEETSGGARVLIKTGNAEALAAVHAFLRYQITEHRTGDPLVAPR